MGNALTSVLLLALFSPAAAAAQELYLSGTVAVAGEAKTVGSICVVMGGGSQAQLAKLLSTPLPSLSSHPALIPALDLRNMLAKAVNANFVLVGGPLIYLPASISSRAERAFYTSLLQEIETALPERSLRIEVWAAEGQKPDLAAAHGRLQFEFPSGASSPTALASNGYIGYKGRENATYRYLPVTIRVSALVPVARRAISYGSAVPASAVDYVVRNVSRLSGTPADISGSSYVAKTDIPGGSVIYRYMVGKKVVITAGKQIRIAFRRGNVVVTVPGSAYQSGSLGDEITVAPASGGTQFHGTIVSPREVVVED